jgi:diguanylate cyclase (GGDEF)-like protein
MRQCQAGAASLVTLLFRPGSQEFVSSESNTSVRTENHSGGRLMSWSLQRKVTLMIVLLIVSLAATLSAVIGDRARTDIQHEVGKALADTANQMTSRLDQYMWGRTMEVRMLSEMNEFKSSENAAAAEALLNRMQKNVPAFSWIGITDRNGIVWAATNHILVGTSLAQRPVYSEGIKGEFIGDVHDAVLLAKLLPNPSGEPLKFVDISMPVKDDTGTVRNVIAAHLSWEWAKQLEQSMFQPIQGRKQEEVLIVSRLDQTVLLGSTKMLGEKLDVESVRRAFKGETGWVQETWPDGQDYITGFDVGEGYLDFPGLHWVVLVRKPVGVAHASAEKLQWFIWLLAGIFATGFAVAGWIWSGKLTKPLLELAKAADRIRFGGGQAVVVHKGIREIEMLTNSLQELIDSISIAQSEVSKLEVMASRDRLTDLPNRIGLETFLLRSQARVLRRKDESLVVLFMDLDGFKTVNDTHGHGAGDKVLQETARKLQECIREDELVARIGGDEFVAVLFAARGHEQESVRAIAARIIQTVNEPVQLETASVQVGCSIGAGIWDEAVSMEVTLQRADEALYHAKRAGKNRLAFP